MNQLVKIEALVGKTLKSIEGLKKHSGYVLFETKEGEKFAMYHDYECCESVSLEDFECDITKVSGAIIKSAQEVQSSGASCTWTFYKIETNKGEIWMRWYGESNGYYSEAVSIYKINQNNAD